MRTQEEILARLREVSKEDFFGFSQEVLLGALDFEHAKPFLKEGVTPDQWAPALTEEALKKDALNYLTFAWGKAEDHRGISASRSVDKMTQYCWLLGYDVKSIEEAGYAQYGCPKLKAAAELLGAPLPTEPALVRMMDGEPCGASYECGCGT
jgi:hypothetical protein